MGALLALLPLLAVLLLRGLLGLLSELAGPLALWPRLPRSFLGLASPALP